MARRNRFALSCQHRLGVKVAALLASVALLAVALCACSQGASSDGAEEESNETSPIVTSTAMVVYANGNDLLFVDTETDTPYVPAIPETELSGINGNRIEAADLQVGNIVRVEGNGIMLDSYPGQYPGITSITVIETGNPEDAAPYQDLVDTVFAPADPSSLPSAALEYTTDQAQVSVALDPYSCRWNTGIDGETDEQALDGSYADDSGLIITGTPDARILQATEATVVFDRPFQSVELNRTPITSTNSEQPYVELTATEEPVDHETQATGAMGFIMDPGYVYVINATFEKGEASFAFIAVE